MLKKLFTVLTACLLSLGWAQAESVALQFQVKDYGAVGDGKTDDGPAIRKAIAAAIAAAKPATVLFEKKTYRVEKQDDRWESFVLEGAKDILIDGQGAMLVFSPDNRAFMLNRCTNCVIKNFEIDYDPLPFTQGDVIAINEAEGTFDLQLHAGYPLPPTQDWMDAHYPGRGGWRFGPIMDGASRRFTPRMMVSSGYVFPKTVNRIDPEARRYRVRVHDPKSLRFARVGDGFVLRVRYSGSARIQAIPGLPVANIQIDRSADCRLENIRQYCSPNMSVHLWANTGRITLDGYQVTYKPGTNRLVNSLSDGVHCKAMKIGPIIENCLFEGLMDDSINISAMADIVEEVIAPDILRTTCTSIAWYVDPVMEGDEYQIIDMVAGKILGRAKVVKVTDEKGHRRTLHFDRAVDGIYGRPDPKDRRGCWFFNLDACGRDYIIRNNRFGLQKRSAVLVRGPGLIENNTIDGTGGLAVYMLNEMGFPEGPVPHDVIIRNNIVKDARHHPAFAIAANSYNPEMTMKANNIRIENNDITMATDFPAIKLSRINNLTLKNNRIRVEEGIPAYEINQCEIVVDEGNQVEQIRTEDTPRDARFLK
jgi:hypothetical protein